METCVTLDDVIKKVPAANIRKDWREVLKREGRMEEMRVQGYLACGGKKLGPDRWTMPRVLGGS